MSIFSEREMGRRMEAFRAGLAERGLDGAFLHTSDNAYYIGGVPLLSEWGRPMWAVVETKGRSAVIGAGIEKENMEANAATDAVLTYADEENVTQAGLKLATDFFGEGGSRPARLGIERDLIPLGIFEALKGHLPNAELVEVGDLLSALRVVKSEEELHVLELGGTIAKLGANAFLDAIGENVTELTVAAHAVAEMNKAMGALFPAGGTSTYAYCQIAEHAYTPHLHPTGKRLQAGDVVALNVFPVISGYCMELERTFIFGHPTMKQRKALEAVNEAQDAAIAAYRPGARMSDIDRLTRDMLTARGYGDCLRHGTGHAHGIMIGAASREELAELRIYNDNVLAPNMITSIEPGVFADCGTFRHSDVFICTEDGARWLTEFPRDIAYGA